MSEAELEPCPFCGGPAEIKAYGGVSARRTGVKCTDVYCAGSMRLALPDEDHVAMWNRRAALKTEGEPVAWPDREAVALADCPPGLFLFNGTLGFKTEYRGMETVGPVNVPGDQVRWRVGTHSEVYVASSGEAFWGGVTKKDDREALLVTPVDVEAILSGEV